MNDWRIGAVHVVALVLACFAGWVWAHNAVATECNKLGSFYVGSKVYECKEKK